jgi:hypothetical protein
MNLGLERAGLRRFACSPFPTLAVASAMTTARLALLVAALLLAGCAEEFSDAQFSTQETLAMKEVRQTSSSASSGSTAPQTPSTARENLKFVKRARLRFRVNDYAEARAAVPRRVQQADGYVASSEERRTGPRRQVKMTARVPAQHFDALVDTLLTLAEEIDTRRLSVEDVTEEFVDVQARLRTRRAVEERYVSLLNEADTVEDILRVEDELSQVREQIERVKGRLKYLKDRVALSTVRLTSYERLDRSVLSDAPGFFERSGGAFVSGWQGLLRLMLVLINLWPLLLVAALGAYAFHVYRTRRPSSETAPATPSAEQPAQS